MSRQSSEPEVTLTIDGGSLSADSVQGRVSVSTPFRFSVVCRVDSDGPPAKQLLGKSARLVVQPVVGPPLFVHGVVQSVVTETARRGQQSHLEHRLEIAPPTGPLEIGRDHRYFQDCTAVDVLQKIMSRSGVDAASVRYNLAATYAKRPYVTQWAESDWTFVERLLAEEGIAYRFDFTEDATEVVFFDDSTIAPDVNGGAIRLASLTGLEADTDAVHDIRWRHGVRPEKVVLNDYNPEKPALKQDAIAEAGNGLHAHYDAPGRYASPADGKALAIRRLEALQAVRAVISGYSTNPRLWPGRIVEIPSAPGLADGRVLVTELEVDVVSRGAHRGKASFRFSGVPAKTPYRSLGKSPTPSPTGPQTARIAGPSGKELHTDDIGRVRAQFYWDREGKGDDHASTFMRVGQFALGNSMVRPRIGWDVLVEHHSGDVDRPLVVSHLYDGASPPPYPLPANKSRTSWQTATTPGGGSSNEIRFEDKKGSEEIFLNASKDMVVAIGDTKAKQVGANHTHDIGASSQIKVGSSRNTGVTADQKYKVSAAESVTISGNATTTVGGSETVTVGAAKSVTVTMGKNLDASGGRSLTVGGNMMDISALGVNRAVLGSASVTVGSAWISAAGAGYSNMTLGAAAETVGGVKLQVGVGGVELKAMGALAETVGGAYVAAAGGDFGEAATGAVSFLVGGAFIVNAPSIEITADSEISIVCGGASIKITSGAIEISAPAIPIPAGMIKKDGGKVDHNP